MKNIIIIISTLLLTLSVQTTEAQSNTLDHFTVKVDGLGCPYCAFGLEKKFKELKGIKNQKIQMETGILTFEFPADKSLSIEKVQKQVNEAGYTPVHVTVKRANGIVEESTP